MSGYKLTGDADIVQRLSDNAFISKDPDSQAWKEYQAWLANGNNPALDVDLIGYAKDVRWQKENGGITVAGFLIDTNDRSKIMIMGSRIAADADPNWSTEWDTDNGSFALNGQMMVVISDAVQAHVNACFRRFSLVKSGIADGSIRTYQQIAQMFGTLE